MGWFEIKTGDQAIRLPNHLSWACHEHHLLPCVFDSGLTLAFSMGFCGAWHRLENERPNPDTVTHSFAPSRELGISDLTGTAVDNNANAGAAADDDQRGLQAYNEHEETFEVVRDGDGAIATGTWCDWTNALAWQKYGTWAAPGGWPAEVDYPQPGNFQHTNPAEVDVGWPWQKPRIGTQDHPEVDLPRMAGYPVDTVFVTVNTEELPVEALAVAATAAPFWWRPGYTITARYCSRIAGRCSAEFAYRIARRWFMGEALPYTSLRAALLASEPTPHSSYLSASILLDEKSIGSWTYHAYVPYDAGPPEVPEVTPYASLDTSPQWTNSTGDTVTPAVVAVIAHNSVTDRDEFLLWKSITPVAVLDTEKLTVPLEFSLKEILDA